MVERAIIKALAISRGGEGGRAVLDIKDLARYVAHYRVCGEAIDDHYHVHNCPIRNKEGWAIAKAQGSGEPYPGPPPATRSELESVRRALRNLRKQGLVAIEYKIPARTFHARPRKKPAERRIHEPLLCDQPRSSPARPPADRNAAKPRWSSGYQGDPIGWKKAPGGKWRHIATGSPSIILGHTRTPNPFLAVLGSKINGVLASDDRSGGIAARPKTTQCTTPMRKKPTLDPASIRPMLA